MISGSNNNKSWIAGIIAAGAASLCCITPLLAILGGAGGFASSFSWLNPYRPLLLGLTVLAFAFAWYKKLKPAKAYDCGCEPVSKSSFWQSKTFLAIMTLMAALLMTFPLYPKLFYAAPEKSVVIFSAKENIKTAEFKISGMTCEACSEHVNNEVAKVNGVIAWQTSYDSARSIITFDPAKTSTDSIIHAIDNTGYTAVISR